MFISYHQQNYYDSSSILFVSSFIIVSNKPFILLSHDNSIISNLQIKKNMIGLNMIKRDSSSSSSSSSSRSIEELYQLAMKEDEEWYNSFIKDVLGENEVIENKSKDIIKNMDKKKNNGEDNTMMQNQQDSKNSSKGWYVGQGQHQEQEQVKREERSKENMKRSKESNMDNKINMTPKGGKNNSNNDIKQDDSITEQKFVEENQDNISSTKNNNKDDEDGDFIINFVDMYNIEQKVPMSIMSRLGYRGADIVKLRAEVLELIIEDEIPIPNDKDGVARVPRRWMVESKDDREVKILQKRKATSIQDDNENTIPHRGEKRRGPRSQYDDIAEKRRRNRSTDIRRRGRRQSKREREARNISSSRSSSFWMDIPTFKQYLRREAELRLSILGPDWEEWVKGESNWRLNLYQGWLELIEDGVGDDVFEDISYAPPEMRSRSRTNDNSITKSRKSRSTMPRGRRPPRQRPRPTSMRSNNGNDDDEVEYQKRPRRRRDNNDDNPRRQRDMERIDREEYQSRRSNPRGR